MAHISTLVLVVSVLLGLIPCAAYAQQLTVGLQIVKSGAELLGALNRTEVEWIGLRGDVLLTEEDVRLYQLPLVIKSNRTVTIAPLEAPRVTLDFGGVLQLLWQETGSRLNFRNLTLQGGASVREGQDAGVSPEEQGYAPLWPTVNGADKHVVYFEGVEILRRRAGCSPELMQNIVQAFKQLLGPGPTLVANNLTFYAVGNATIPVLLVDAHTKEEVGRVAFLFTNFTVVCVDDGGGAQLGTVQVSTGSQLLDALNRSTVASIALLNDVLIGEGELRAHQLPKVIGSSRSVSITSAGMERMTLDFSSAQQVLWLEPRGSLVFKMLKLQGGAPASTIPTSALPIDRPAWSALWPIVAGAAGHDVTFEDVFLEQAEAGCSPQLVSSMAQAFQRQTNATVLYYNTTMQLLGSATLQQQIVDSATKQEEGLATYHFQNFTVFCVADPPNDGPGASSGGSSNTRVSILVGVLCGTGVAVAVAAGLLLWRARRRRRAAAGDLSKLGSRAEQLVSDLDGAGLLVMEAGEATPPPLETSGSQDLRSAGLGPEAGGLGVATLWKTRVGPIAGLELGEMLGRGSFGKVYKGRWKGAIVAVKVVEQHITGREANRLAREPLLSVSLSHPHIITTYRLAVICVKPDEALERQGNPMARSRSDSAHSPLGEIAAQSSGMAGGSGSSGNQGSQGSGNGGQGALDSLPSTHGSLLASGGAPGSSGRQAAGAGAAHSPAAAANVSVSHSEKAFAAAGAAVTSSGSGHLSLPSDALPSGIYETLLVMEFCDRGSLTSYMMTGKFFNPATNELDLVPVLLSLLEVAQGMEYIHDLNLVHGDLKGRNVLLKTARVDRRGFTCKIVDFGLSRMLGHEQTHVDTASYGTPSHAAPELLGQGKASKASDVYAFAMLMWEMVSAQEAHSELSTFQLIAQITRSSDFRPVIPPSCPPALASLMERCWVADPQARPIFSDIVEELRVQLLATRRMPDARGPGASGRSFESAAAMGSPGNTG